MKVCIRLFLSSAHLPAIRRLHSRQPAHKDALLYFVWPQNGATIKGDSGAASDYGHRRYARRR